MWFLLRGSVLSSASQKPVVRQLFWQVQYDWHPSSVSGITGDLVVVRESLCGGIDSYFCGRGNNFRSWQPAAVCKLRVHSCRGKETVTAHAEDSCLFFCLHTIQAAVSGACNCTAATIMRRSMKLRTKRFSFSVLNQDRHYINCWGWYPSTLQCYFVLVAKPDGILATETKAKPILSDMWLCGNYIVKLDYC